MNVDFTSQLEAELDEVEEAQQSMGRRRARFYDPFAADSRSSQEHPGPKDGRASDEHSLREMRPDDGDQNGRNGKFLACPGYKEDPPCKNTQNFENCPTARSRSSREELNTDQVWEKCGSPMLVKTDVFGKFIACSAYPECKTTKPLALGGMSTAWLRW